MPEKGRPVFLAYDQAALDAAYDQAAYAPNREQLIKRRIRDSELTRLRIGEPERVAYGPAEIERLDIYRAGRAAAPVFVYLSASRLPLSLTACASASGRVRDEQVERIPRPGSRRREGLEGIGEIFTVRAVNRC
jgi:hypothetical protein